MRQAVSDFWLYSFRDDRICAGSRQKSPTGKCITEYSPWYGNGIRYADRNCADHLLFQDHSCDPEKICKKAEPEAEAPKAAPVAAAPVQETDDLELVAVIAAAIAASENVPVDSFRVRTIKRR